MAKKHKGHKRHHSRRRVGAMHMNAKSGTIKLLFAVGGYFLSDMINGPIDSMLAPAAGTTDSATTAQLKKYGPAVAEVGAGYALLSSKKSSMLKTAAGGILAGAGAKRMLKNLGVVSGYQSVPVIAGSRMRGYQSVPVIAGVPGQLQGIPAQLQGFRVNGYDSQGSGVMGAVESSKVRTGGDLMG